MILKGLTGLGLFRVDDVDELMMVMTMTMMMTSSRTKMGGLEGTNRLGGRVEQPITPLHTSNPKPTMQFRRAHVTSVTLHLKFKTESSRYMRSYRGSQPLTPLHTQNQQCS